jgi:hypothetical protein
MTRLLALFVVLMAARAAAQEGFIPPRAASELGIPAETLRRVEELAYTANEEAIELEAAVRRAQMALDRELRAQPPEEAKLVERIDALTKADGAMRRNRILLLARVRRALGEELWRRLEGWRAENPPPGRDGMRPERPGPGPGGGFGGPGPRFPGERPGGDIRRPEPRPPR